MRKIVLGLLLVLAACRSLPRETADNIATANTEASAALIVWTTKIASEANKGEASQADPAMIWVEWADHFHKLVVARDAVQTYLDTRKGDEDVSLGYSVATRLLLDIDSNINMVINNWPLWIDPTSNTAKFIEDVNKMIADYRMLNRKFNEWANQFKVK